ncbi:MAG: MbnP family protein [Saprospiraceae bacterium]
MNKSTLFVIQFLLFSYLASAQQEILLSIVPRLGNQQFALDAQVTHPGGTYPMKFTRFEYYISEIKITHDGGIVTPCNGLYLLVRPNTDSIFNLGQLPDVQKIEAITFSIGVPEDVNHLDPTTYLAGHPLAPQDPSMHWGWTAGYRFSAIEGDAGTNLSQHFEIHSLGDANYKTQTILVSSEQIAGDKKIIRLIAYYDQSVKNVNLSTGPIVHGTSGAAVTVLNNFKNLVFKAQAMTAVKDPSFQGVFDILSNPIKLGSMVDFNYSLTPGNKYEIGISTLSGKKLIRRTISSGENQSLSIQPFSETGIYLINLYQNDQPVVVKKLMVLN